jgi:hypothetical protein
LVVGEKKDGCFISSLFLPVIESLDVLKDKVDVVFFDGGSNFQLAGRIIMERFPRITVVHGLEHVLSLVFVDISKIPVIHVSYFVLQSSWPLNILTIFFRKFIQQLNLQVKRLYRTFGSGSNHKPYAFFMQHSKTYNKGRRVGLLRSAETRFASFFYAMHRALCCREALESTVHSAQWKDLKRLKAFITRAANDVKDKTFWKRLFVLLRALFPLLKLLRCADSNKPNMDKVCYHVHQIRMHLIRSKDDLMDEELFPANYSISKADEEDGNYDSGSECEEDDEEEEQAIPAFTAEEEDLDVYEVDNEWGTLVTDETKGIFTPILDAIAKRTPKMLHDFAWLAFVCSIRPDIVEDAKVRIVGNGPVRNMIEDCVRRLLSHDVDGELDGTIDRKIDLFWDELTHFQNRCVCLVQE